MLITIEFVISEGIDLAKSKNSKERMTCRYWFFSHGFKFQDSVWNGCHKGLSHLRVLKHFALDIVQKSL